jgi:uncharacterized protein YyaL (SSP411 family)
MKKLLFFLIAGGFLMAFQWSGKVDWAMTFSSASQIAAKEHKLIMVDVSLSDCPPCRYLASTVYTNKEVASYINKHFVPVLYLADRDSLPVIVQSYFTGSTPTIMFLKPNGELFYRFIGARPPKMFLQILQAVEAKYKGQK